MEHLIIWHSNFWLGFIFEWKTLLLCFVLENIQNQKGLALGVMFSYFTIFHILLEVFKKFNAYFDLFLKQKFKDPFIAWSKIHTLRASGMKNIISDRKVKISWKFTHIFSSKLVIFLSFFHGIVSTHTMFEPSIWFNSMNQHFWAQNIKLCQMIQK